MDKESILKTIKDLTQYVVNLGKEEVKLEEAAAVEVVEQETVEQVVEAKDTVEVENEVQFVSMDDFNKAIEDIKGLFSKQYEKFSTEKKELEKEKEELKVELSKKPDAAKINHSPAEVKQVELSTTADRILFAIKNKRNG